MIIVGLALIADGEFRLVEDAESKSGIVQAPSTRGIGVETVCRHVNVTAVGVFRQDTAVFGILILVNHPHGPLGGFAQCRSDRLEPFYVMREPVNSDGIPGIQPISVLMMIVGLI